ncbi:AAA family ATPase [Paraconexibacter antarcticus]|uniref:AAA family ATPase n=1 Tax=Paraconexibacter antarcticus TaxID=2949664 RepID=A0ABY5DT23_9ACTN|nr:LuxR family transcriptional regulator [Paraconexibacter antarcticus]UTI65168.1 AAA family ATPase [Paraconexibacter antarcticus]
MRLYERDLEIETIDRRLVTGGLLLVEGPAGIGKSSLLSEAARRGLATRRVLQARGTLLEVNYAFGVARQLFESALRGSERSRLLAGAAGAAAAAVDPHTTNGAADAAGFAVLRGLAALTINIAERGPLLLVVDDLQWADTPSLRFVAFLARRLDGPDIALAVGVRTGEAGAADELLEDVRSEHTTSVLRPTTLSQTATTALVHERDPHADAATCIECHAATGGNPLLVTEVARAIDEGLDPIAAAASGIGPGVRRRIENADPCALGVARAAAVLGDGATLARIATLAATDAVDVGRAITALTEAEVLTKTPEPYTFTHPLVQAAVLESLDTGERIALHRLAAATLEAEGEAGERIAAHLLATPGTADPQVVARLRHVAAEALNRGAARSAVPLLRRALAEPPARTERCDVLRELATAERLVGDAAAVAHLRTAQSLAADAHARAGLARDLAMAQYDLSYYEDAAQTLSTALREAPEDLDPRARDTLRVDLLTVALQASSIDADQLLSDIGRGPASADPAVMIALRIASLALRLLDGPVADTLPELEQILRDTPPSPERLDVHTPLWFALVLCERFDVVREMLDEVEASGGGWMRRQFALNLARARLEHRLGDLDAALATHEANLEIGLDNRTGTLFTLAGLVSVCVDRGDIPRALSALSTADIPASRTESHLSWMHWAVGRALAAAGDDVAAARAFDAGCAIQRGFPDDRTPVWEEGGADRIACSIRLGREREARADVEHTLAVARRAELRGLEGIALRLRGVLDSDSDSLETSVQLLEQTPMRLELARSLCELGSARRRAGQRTQARAPLRRALDLAHACGARPLADRARQELTLAGARPRRDAETGRDALTAAERRVARLVASGRTNRETAQELFITVKTVEGHVAHIFRKLDIHRRTDLPAALDADREPMEP